MRPIDADALTDKAEILYQHTSSGVIIPWSAVRVCVINNIKTIVAKTIQPLRWIYPVGYGNFPVSAVCPACRRMVDNCLVNHYRYCPYCGHPVKGDYDDAPD